MLLFFCVGFGLLQGLIVTGVFWAFGSCPESRPAFWVLAATSACGLLQGIIWRYLTQVRLVKHPCAVPHNSLPLGPKHDCAHIAQKQAPPTLTLPDLEDPFPSSTDLILDPVCLCGADRSFSSLTDPTSPPAPVLPHHYPQQEPDQLPPPVQEVIPEFSFSPSNSSEATFPARSISHPSLAGLYHQSRRSSSSHLSEELEAAFADVPPVDLVILNADLKAQQTLVMTLQSIFTDNPISPLLCSCGTDLERVVAEARMAQPFRHRLIVLLDLSALAKDDSLARICVTLLKGVPSQDMGIIGIEGETPSSHQNEDFPPIDVTLQSPFEPWMLMAAVMHIITSKWQQQQQ